MLKIVCPYCGCDAVFAEKGELSTGSGPGEMCGRCHTLILDRLDDGTPIPRIPEKMDRSRRYEVLGYPREGQSSFFYPGGTVTLAADDTAGSDNAETVGPVGTVKVTPDDTAGSDNAAKFGTVGTVKVTTDDAAGSDNAAKFGPAGTVKVTPDDTAVTAGDGKLRLTTVQFGRYQDVVPPTVYADGICGVSRFIMPERAVIVTRKDPGMMRADVFRGPYGEILRSPVFGPETILPSPGYSEAKKVVCRSCGKKTPPFTFCTECGARLTLKVECRVCGFLTGPGETCECCGAELHLEPEGFPSRPPRRERVKCHECGKDVRFARYCEECGSRLVIPCPSCRKPVRFTNFCEECGARLRFSRLPTDRKAGER